MRPFLIAPQTDAVKRSAGRSLRAVEYRKKGSKHSIKGAQAWWYETPPRDKPLFNHAACSQAIIAGTVSIILSNASKSAGLTR